MTMPGSCSSGFRSRPSGAAGSSRSKGFEVSSVKSRKPHADQPHHAEHARQRALVELLARTAATANVQPASISAHSSIEPSWLPQTRGEAVGQRQQRCWSGWRRSAPRSRWSTKAQVRQPIGDAARTGTVHAPSGRASAIQLRVAVAAHRAAAACSGSAPWPAPGSARSGRVRESWFVSAVSAPWASGPLALPSSSASAASGGM